jgi:hypothetical protein
MLLFLLESFGANYNLQDEINYTSTHNIENAVGLVVKKNENERKKMSKKK